MPLTHVAIVAVDGFSPFHYAVPCILFGDTVSGETRFKVTICAEKPGLLTSKDGFALNATQDFSAIGQADIVVVPYWQHVLERPPQALLDSLVQAKKRGAAIVGLCLGAFVLGYAGILDGKRAATHWEFERQFQSLFPKVQLDINALYVDDDHIITSAGTAAALDCCLYIIRQRFGSVVANQIARRMIVPPHREGGQAQFIAQPVPKDTRDARINCLIDYLQQHIAQPHNLDSLAAIVSMSRRTLTRHFTHATGMSVADWLSAERLRRSQILLESGNLPIESVAAEVGFASAVTYRQQFKARFGVSPMEWRKTFRTRA
ncbi:MULTISPECIES: GlxA family transcriptional regulator [Enterobacter]|jgi:transcriptional regulator GlxA family with amidase domain|uniref:AraC family transcriptional regulator n=1 Tax=Enterobacter cancerogenus TaxID=69218 RepID=A0AAP8TGN2_9ENTR|nr:MULTISPECIES: helix-turn-helix domain-containing protein [Enterobacter]AUJ79600.1 AraC family transcriptional regulator [Enterobacter cancerogenus]EFC55011.1 transcriptional regulator, AraC family [Enterobacter cancerogenus ATCC 35316]PNF13024.1 AraC family transcriptional regulator [Enterobacter cancerogenus]QGG10203.1 helix-turn-helix domain-containing protein [Enterobacter cancerogenus]TKK16816.1 AraC family transcriptional regulator [Enterobacter cancerogenus]